MTSLSQCRKLVHGLDHPEAVAVGAGGELYAGGGLALAATGSLYVRCCTPMPSTGLVLVGGWSRSHQYHTSTNLDRYLWQPPPKPQGGSPLVV